MPVVTSIKPQKNQKRVNVYLDDKFGFGVDLENFVKLNLKVEQELSDQEVAEIIKKAEFQKILNKLLRFASLRPRSRKEIDVWFKKYKVHESFYKELIRRLKHFDLVDDKKFAKWWVEQRNAFRPRPKRILSYELRIKGVVKEVIDEVLENSGVDELQVAKKLLARNAYKWKKFDQRKAKQKMSEFLGRKGFSWDVIDVVIKKAGSPR